MLLSLKCATWILIVFYLNARQGDGLRILGIFPFQMSSHFITCEQLMRGLAAKGYQVDVYSHFPLTTPVPNYRDFSLQGTLPPISNNVTYEVATASDLFSLKNNWFESRQKAICELLGHPHFQKLLHNPPRDPPYDLVITELSIVHCYIPFGRHLNVPVIGVVTPSLFAWQYSGFQTPINLAVDPCTNAAFTTPMTFCQRLINLLTHECLKFGFALYTHPQNKYVEKYFGPGLPNVVDLQKDISLVLANYDASLFGIRTFSPKVVPVPGLHIVDHNETLPQIVKKWLDESTEGCVYFALGSMVKIETFPKHVLDVFYKSFQNIAPLRVLLKITNSSELPPGLPSNVLTQSWFQQMPVLKHKNVKAFVTHGGLLGTQEAIYFGIPMVGFPLFFDHHFDMNHYVKKNIAIKIDVHEITETRLTNALMDVLKNPLYKNSIEKLSRQFKDRPLSPMNSAIYWIEYVHRYGKDVLKSPTEDIPWCQACLLDIYGFIVACILIASSTSFYLLKEIIRRLQAKLHLIGSSLGKKEN
ncbi:UDP-glucosyltransferase 2-like [Phymastichus coffea]|uniref:UDP-glucosyltransferase 2-like n=1 Tax=Phymastichus coffea TaxID=108790 RepID=UPI00273BE5EF|nr:UDP-glucosyltransferase 2-like [Phymastichus coffea]